MRENPRPLPGWGQAKVDRDLLALSPVLAIDGVRECLNRQDVVPPWAGRLEADATDDENGDISCGAPARLGSLEAEVPC